MNLKLIPKNTTILIGFSGGPDSVYLLLELKKIQASHNLQLIALHLDHEWRTDSKQEATWCNSFCKKYNVPIITKKASELKSNHTYKGSKEEFARRLRQQFFKKVAQDYPKSLIALGHHQDDQLETFFIRLARGSSLSGITGIKSQQGNYIRPLLTTTKQEIINTLKQNNISYLQDPTNQELSFLRNRIRHLLIPQLTKIDTRLPKNIVATMQHLLEVDSFLQEITDKTIQELSITSQSNFLNISSFLKINTVLQQRIILQLLIAINAEFTPSKSLFAEIIRFLQHSSKKEHIMHKSYKVVKNNNLFSIIKR